MEKPQIISLVFLCAVFTDAGSSWQERGMVFLPAFLFQGLRM